MKLELFELTKKFMSLRGKVTAVDGVDLEVKDGEFFVLLGPSGCGKSTLLNLIAGLEKPTYGEIRFDGRTAASAEKKVFLTPRERNVAFVFQSYALYPHMSVMENIVFPLKVMGERDEKIRQSVELVSSMLKISSLLSAKPAELSGGQKQRVAIARAVVRHPNVFLLDEPLSNLDAQLRASTRDELKRLQRSLGVTTVYVTHDQIEALTLGDRIALLKDGKVEQVGTPEDLYERPATIFAAKFIGSPPMNIFKAKYFKEDKDIHIIIDGEKMIVPKEKTGSLEKLKDSDCVIGLRPEDIHIARPGESFSGAGNDGGVGAKVELIELLGRDRLIHVSIGSIRASALTSESGFSPGETVKVEFDLKKMPVFARGE